MQSNQIVEWIINAIYKILATSKYHERHPKREHLAHHMSHVAHQTLSLWGVASPGYVRQATFDRQMKINILDGMYSIAQMKGSRHKAK